MPFFYTTCSLAGSQRCRGNAPHPTFRTAAFAPVLSQCAHTHFLAWMPVPVGARRSVRGVALLVAGRRVAGTERRAAAVMRIVVCDSVFMFN